jgi:hypothetical protein
MTKAHFYDFYYILKYVDHTLCKYDNDYADKKITITLTVSCYHNI